MNTLNRESSKSHVFYRSTGFVTPCAVSAEGCYIIDSNGKRYLDGTSGAAVNAFGHNHPRILSAIQYQLKCVAGTYNAFFTSTPQEELSQHLFELSDGHLARSVFSSSGTAAVEVALKLARQYHVERGEADRVHVISREKSYHGNTIGSMSVSGLSMPMHQPYTYTTTKIPAYFPYYEKPNNETEDEYGLRCANALEAAIIELDANTVSAFIVETVSGSSLGAVPTPPSYLKRIREICDQYGVLLILDEVMCGAGRTGTFFAYEQELVRPDIIVLAKGLAGGYIPLYATCVTAPVYDAVEQGSGILSANYTQMGHPLACSAGLGVMDIIRNTDLLSSVSTKGELLKQKLRERFKNNPHVDYIRGRGLFIGIELVLDKETKAPFPSDSLVFDKVRREAFELGLVCMCGKGSAEKGGDFILLAPPYIITDEQMDELVDLLGTAVDNVTLN